MKAALFHAALRALPVASPVDVTGGRPFVVLAPHPDDETLGLGGLIAASCEAGVDVRVVVVSDGSQSHPHSRQFPHDSLIALRQSEVAEAVRQLGLRPDRLTQLGLPDTRVPTQGPDFEAAVAHMVAIVDDAQAASVFVTWRRDPHCDHEATAAMARALRDCRPDIALWFYPIWGWHLDAETMIDEPPPSGVRIDIASWLPAKQAAIAAHVSQMTSLIDDDPDGFRFTPQTLAPFLQPVETVFEVPR